ncbi:dTMP kinase [Geoalkalibacter subterraneus]|uniref:Thymidylate kinase n=1 Tax=Geoalkalibacter subterraneus TaxID=483547 RepID=A0A0B5FXF3_9BACT|nr:dTMP kinase [Geoalkalibacter subterraneus]AJF08271.1 thymidylate kinase [Geoalkalibacter subterraneus]
MGRNLFSFEGGEGSGKSTLILKVAEALRVKGIEVVLTREPGGCPIGQKVREILLDARNSEIVSRAELLLYAAGRAQHVEEVIVPALERGAVVLCDRYCDSTEAYQGYGRGLDLTLIRELNQIATGGIYPQTTFLLDLPPEIGLGRALSRVETASGKEGRFERESLRFHHRVRFGYWQLAAREPRRMFMIDARLSPEGVFEATMKKILGAMKVPRDRAV